AASHPRSRHSERDVRVRPFDSGQARSTGGQSVRGTNPAFERGYVMLMRFDPFREIDRMTEEAFRRPSRMPMDAYRRGHLSVVNFDLPGVDANTIDLTVEQNTLTVTAERTWVPVEGDELVIAERPQGTFIRQLL